MSRTLQWRADSAEVIDELLRAIGYAPVAGCMECREQEADVTNERRIRILKRLVKEEEDRITFLESELSESDDYPAPEVDRCHDNIAVYTRMITRLQQKS